MFSKEELKSLDRKYFAVIAADEYDVTVMSRNTGHYWYIHNPEYPGKGSCIIFHKHKGHHICIISMAGRIRCGRRCGASGGMTGGR